MGCGNESRFLLIGMTTTRHFVVVAHTDRGGRVRIINTRRATRYGRASYEKGAGQGEEQHVRRLNVP